MDLLKRLPPLIQKRLKIIGGVADKLELRAVLVGGTVRDILWSKIQDTGHLHSSLRDIDVAVESMINADAVSSLVNELRHRLPVEKIVSHKDFMTYALSFRDGVSIDIATARREIYEHPAALPKVSPAPLEEDLLRRDFTVNAMAVFISGGNSGQLFSPHSGSDDLKKKTLRVFHEGSFEDDPTRIFRAAKYCGRFGLTPEYLTGNLIHKAIKEERPTTLSPARLHNEFLLLLKEQDARPAFSLLVSWDALKFFGKNFVWDSKNFANVNLRLGPCKVEDLSLYRLLWLAYWPADVDNLTFIKSITQPPWGSDWIVNDLKRLQISNAILNKIRDTIALLRKVEYGKCPPDIKTLNSIDSTQMKFLSKAMEKKLWQRCLISRPCLRGKDLLNLGLKPGPLVGKALNSLVEARWNGKIKTRAEETEFIANSYRK